MPPITRFAPSPTGYLHLGHAAAALLAWRRAREAGGRFLLRLEDIDGARCQPGFAAAIIEDLGWLGLDWDGPVRVQSHHMAQYRAALDTLAARGLTYPCFCSRTDIALAAPHGSHPAYPGTCRALGERDRRQRIDAGMAFAVRLDMARAIGAAGGGLTFHDEAAGTIACDPRPFGDVVLARRDVPASYHLCVAHDDALQGVTLVTRGSDLLPATHIHRLLQALFGWPVPGYAHHPLLTDARGRRLAKRDRALSLRALREQGATAEEVRARAVAAPATGA